MITEKSNWWVDENGNKWNVDIFSMEDASRKSATLINCRDCINCSNCYDCVSCDGCSFCVLCQYCTDCFKCHYCTFCDVCTKCRSCHRIKDFKENPQCIRGWDMGDISEAPCVYWCNDKTQVVYGFFCGTLKDFEHKVDNMRLPSFTDEKLTCRNNLLKFIKLVKTYMKGI